MYYKLFNEDGDFLDKTTNEPKNLLWGEVIYSPEGKNPPDWKWFDSLELAMQHFNLKEKPKPKS